MRVGKHIELDYFELLIVASIILVIVSAISDGCAAYSNKIGRESGATSYLTPSDMKPTPDQTLFLRWQKTSSWAKRVGQRHEAGYLHKVAQPEESSWRSACQTSMGDVTDTIHGTADRQTFWKVGRWGERLPHLVRRRSARLPIDFSSLELTSCAV